MTAEGTAGGGPVVHHVGQATVDPDRAVAFYTGLLGFAVEQRMEVPDDGTAYLLDVAPPVGLEAIFLRRGPFVLELLHFRREGNPPRAERVFNEPGLTHLSVSVDDLDGVVARVEGFGGRVLRHIPGSAAMIRDPDGQLLELVNAAFWR